MTFRNTNLIIQKEKAQRYLSAFNNERIRVKPFQKLNNLKGIADFAQDF